MIGSPKRRNVKQHGEGRQAMVPTIYMYPETHVSVFMSKYASFSVKADDTVTHRSLNVGQCKNIVQHSDMKVFGSYCWTLAVSVCSNTVTFISHANKKKHTKRSSGKEDQVKNAA